ncbi:protein HEG homolog 1-like isoform X1 [Petromyzon marinus]|uniref:Protein HEG homolog 1-like n=2 Tax=Petromyzon marinus TaxID=7757 RepID=A0AAJ7X5A6_PETMA|nr:protein HEG homolog 1-like [Petromyzon marinus]
MYSEALLGWTAQLGGQMALQNKPTFPRIPLLLASISCLLMAPGVVSSGNGTSTNTTTTIAPHNTWTGSQDPGSEQPLLLSSSSSPSSFSSSSSSNSAPSTASTDASSSTEDDQLLLSAAETREETPGTTRTELEERGRPSSTAGAAPTLSPTEHGATATVTAATAATAAPGDIAPLTISPPPGGGGGGGGGDAGDVWNSTRATASVSSSTGGWTLPTVANQSAEVARVPSPTTPIHRTPEPARAATAAAAAAATAVDFPTASVRPTAANSFGATVATTPTGEGSPAGPGGTAVVALESSTTVGAVPTGGPESVDAAGAELPPALPVPLAVTRPMRTSTAMDHQGVPTVPRPGSMRPPTTEESSPECNGTTHAGEERDTATPTEAPADVCHPNPCPGGQRCVPEPQGEEGNSSTPGNSSALFTCKCPPGWQGLNCTDDVDECIGDGTNPCPPFSACRNRRGGFVCECPVGFYQDYPRGCLAAKTFLGNITLKNSVFTAEMGDPASSVFVELQDNITRVMNETFKGKNLSYQGTTVLSVTNGSVVVSVLHLFASSSAATNRSVNDAIHNYTGSCTNTSACEFARGTNFSYSEGDVCSLAVCDERSSRCVHVDGDVSCVCRAGFFKHSAMDHVCRACENGYKLHNNACVKCPFGYYGHQCEERYLLVAVILAAMGGGLLVNLAIALSITCYRKRRLEAQRARYKDEGFQLSPYAELPRIPRAQTAWGRETYEMQDSGSTRNLLHPDESYIAPAYQSSVKMGESGQPYSVLPPGQYMYGGQHNPSYVHDDTRRRDYF